MTAAEYTAWTEATKRTANKWTIDQIHDGRNGRSLLIYKGGEAGQFVEAADGLLTIGVYEGAVPHIGEASFKILGRRQFADNNTAITHCVNAGGMRFLLDIISQ